MNHKIDTEFINNIYDDCIVDTQPVNKTAKKIESINETIEILKARAIQYAKDSYVRIKNDHDENKITTEQMLNEIVNINQKFLELDKIIVFKTKRVQKLKKTAQFTLE